MVVELITDDKATGKVNEGLSRGQKNLNRQ